MVTKNLNAGHGDQFALLTGTILATLYCYKSNAMHIYQYKIYKHTTWGIPYNQLPLPLCLELCAMSPTFGRSWRAYRRRYVLLSLLVVIGLLSLVYVVIIAAMKYVANSPSSQTGSSILRSHSSSSPNEHKWCPYYPASVDEIDNIFDSNSLLDLHIIVQKTLTKGTPISLLVASESVLPMLINWMCVTRKSTGSLPENLLVVVPPGDSSVIMKLESKGIPVVQMEFRWEHSQHT